MNTKLDRAIPNDDGYFRRFNVNKGAVEPSITAPPRSFPTSTIPPQPMPHTDHSMTLNLHISASPLREEVWFFAKNMDLELMVNAHKGHWGDIPVEHLIERIQDELDELREAVALNHSPSAVLSEAADTANFCMMAADNYARNYKP